MGVTRSRELQKNVKQELKPAKIRYKNKVQTQRSVGNSHPAWVGVITIMGIKSKKKKKVPFPVLENLTLRLQIRTVFIAVVTAMILVMNCLNTGCAPTELTHIQAPFLNSSGE